MNKFPSKILILLASLAFAIALVTTAKLFAQDERSDSEIMETIKENMSTIDSEFRKAKQQGQDIEPARKLMLDEFRPAMQQKKLRDAEQIQQRVLQMLAGESVPVEDPGEAKEERTDQELMRAIEANMDEINSAMQLEMEAGKDIEPARTIMLEEFGPFMKQGKLREAEQTQQRVLSMLASNEESSGSDAISPSTISSEQTVAGHRRSVDETLYLVFNPDPKDLMDLKGQNMPEAIFQEYAKRFRGIDQGERRKWGLSLIIPSWSAPGGTLKKFIRQAFSLAIEYDVAIHFTTESLDWKARPDLWNYSSPGEKGYDPDNANNVEWSDWDGTPFPHRFRDWGTPEKMAPVICYNSKGVLQAVSEILEGSVAPALVAGMKKLEKAGKSSLFAGITVGSEPELPNYQDIEHSNPKMAKLMDSLDVPKARLGYCALTNLGYSRGNPPPDFADALAEVNRSYTEYWAGKLNEAGIPSSKMYTHVAAGAGVVGSAAVKHTNAPIDIAFTKYTRPGWTTYPNGPLKNSFSVLYTALAEHGNPPWGGTESNPQGLGMQGMPMDKYLDRHYDYGATLVVMNIGATSDTMMARLRDAVWNEEAMEAYQEFLEGR